MPDQIMRMLDSFGMLLRFSVGLKAFLGSTLSGEDCRRMVAESIRERESNFLDLLGRAVYGNRRSPYLALLRRAGAEYGDVAEMVRRDGVEPTLEKLFDAGVSIRLDEFKGLRAIERPGLTLPVKAEDFDNPQLRRDFEAATSGSTGQRRRLVIDLDLLVAEAAYNRIVEDIFEVFDRPRAIWWPAPPGSAGLKNALRAAKCGRNLNKWFSPSRISWRPTEIPSAVLAMSAVWLSRLWGRPIPAPEFVPLEQAWRVAAWLAEQAAAGRHAYLSAPASGVVRVCQAAREKGLDIAGSVLRVSGEPYTEGKRRVVLSAGARAFSSWSISECGTIGGGCARGEHLDDLHLFHGKMALIQRPVPLKHDAGAVDAFHLTSLRRETPKIMLNVDSGDYGVVSRQPCGCPLEELQMPVRVHGIRSYEKLTASGVHIPGTDILELVEEFLPRRHGGTPASYQFVEETSGTESRIAIVVSPSVPHVDEEALLRDVKRFLAGKSRAQRMMMDVCNQGQSLRVTRAEPYTTYTGKTPPLRVVAVAEGTEANRDGR